MRPMRRPCRCRTSSETRAARSAAWSQRKARPSLLATLVDIGPRSFSPHHLRQNLAPILRKTQALSPHNVRILWPLFSANRDHHRHLKRVKCTSLSSLMFETRPVFRSVEARPPSPTVRTCSPAHCEGARRQASMKLSNASRTIASIAVTSSSVSFANSPLTALAAEFVFVEADIPDQVFRDPVRHLDHVHDAAHRLVVAAQEVDLARQVSCRSPARRSHREKFRRFRAIEITVQVGGVVLDIDVVCRCRPPINVVHQRPRMCAQRVAVCLDPVEHDRRDEEHHPRRREFFRSART